MLLKYTNENPKSLKFRAFKSSICEEPTVSLLFLHMSDFMTLPFFNHGFSGLDSRNILGLHNILEMLGCLQGKLIRELASC